MHGVLGAIVAGGASRRFGTDKAQALWRGQSLLDHTVAVLRPQVAHLVIVGRHHPACTRIEDRPPGSGAIGAIAAALHAACEAGYVGALCVPLDVHPLPADLWARLGGARAAVFAEQHLIGWWPVDLAAGLDAYIADGGRAVRGWSAHAGARLVPDPPGLVNINRPSDLARLPE